MDIARRVCGLGFDGFDLFVGPESIPDLPLDAPDAMYQQVREAAEDAGRAIASVVLAGFDSTDASAVERQLSRSISIASLVNANYVHLLPRKVGVTQEQGFRALEAGWRQSGPEMVDSGLTCTVENHVWFPSADDDIFLVRNEQDFNRVLEDTNGSIRIKYDASWLLAHDASLDPVAILQRLGDHVSIVDLKDWKDGTFVAPGTGMVDMHAMISMASSLQINSYAVEVEYHHSWEHTPKDPCDIDRLYVADLTLYQKIAEQFHGE